MPTVTRLITVLYILLLGTTLGASFALGAFVAPVLFNSQRYIGGELLTHFQEGLLMTEIFKKYCFLLELTVVAVVAWEGVRCLLLKQRALMRLLAAAVISGSGLLFSRYFTPAVIKAQTGGPAATASEAFQAMHQASVTDFSFLLVALVALLTLTSWSQSSPDPAS